MITARGVVDGEGDTGDTDSDAAPDLDAVAEAGARVVDDESLRVVDTDRVVESERDADTVRVPDNERPSVVVAVGVPGGITDCAAERDALTVRVVVGDTARVRDTVGDAVAVVATGAAPPMMVVAQEGPAVASQIHAATPVRQPMPPAVETMPPSVAGSMYPLAELADSMGFATTMADRGTP